MNWNEHYLIYNFLLYFFFCVCVCVIVVALWLSLCSLMLLMLHSVAHAIQCCDRRQILAMSKNIYDGTLLDIWLQFGHWEQSNCILSVNARLDGANEQIPHVLSATKTGQWRYMGRYKSQPSIGLWKHQRIQSDHSCWGKYYEYFYAISHTLFFLISFWRKQYDSICKSTTQSFGMALMHMLCRSAWQNQNRGSNFHANFWCTWAEIK